MAVMTKPDLEKILEGVLPVVSSIAAFIKSHFATVKPDEIIEKSVNSLVSYVDQTSEERLIQGLTPLIKNAGFITEEAMTVQQMQDYTWIIDPLDGTTNFLYEIPHFSISVALYYDQEVILGVVCDVMLDEVFTAIQGHGAQCNQQAIHISQKMSFQDVVIGTGFTYKPDKITDAHMVVLKDVLLKTRGIRRIGSAALDLCYVAKGIFGAFYEDQLNAWDIAAGALIVQEAGGIVSDYLGGNNWLFTGEILAAAPQFREDMLPITARLKP